MHALAGPAGHCAAAPMHMGPCTATWPQRVHRAMHWSYAALFSLSAIDVHAMLIMLCVAAHAGSLDVGCAQSGLLLSLQVAKDFGVQGSIEQAATGATLQGQLQAIGSASGSLLSCVHIRLPSQVGVGLRPDCLLCCHHWKPDHCRCC